MTRHVIRTVNHRAEDLEMDDIVKLRLHNRIQWVLLVSDANKVPGSDMKVQITYRPLVGDRATIDLPRYELVPVQIEVGA